MPDISRIAKRFGTGYPSKMFASSEGDIGPRLFVFQDISPDPCFRITPQAKLGDIAARWIQEEEIAQATCGGSIFPITSVTRFWSTRSRTISFSYQTGRMPLVRLGSSRSPS